MKEQTICVEIGCSGLDPDMCLKRPYLCKIVRKLLSCAEMKYAARAVARNAAGAAAWEKQNILLTSMVNKRHEEKADGQ